MAAWPRVAKTLCVVVQALRALQRERAHMLAAEPLPAKPAVDMRWVDHFGQPKNPSKNVLRGHDPKLGVTGDPTRSQTFLVPLHAVR